MQFEAFAVVAPDSEATDGADPEGHQIVQDGARGPGKAADPGDVVDRQAGFDGGLGPGRIDVEITVEAEVSEQRQSKAWITPGDRLESFRGHSWLHDGVVRGGRWATGEARGTRVREADGA